MRAIYGLKVVISDENKANKRGVTTLGVNVNGMHMAISRLLPSYKQEIIYIYIYIYIYARVCVCAWVVFLRYTHRPVAQLGWELIFFIPLDMEDSTCTKTLSSPQHEGTFGVVLLEGEHFKRF